MPSRTQEPEPVVRKDAARSKKAAGTPLWKASWSWVVEVLAFIGLISVVWVFLVPADYGPQYFLRKPPPSIATADTVRRWPALGPHGATEDSVMLRLTGAPLLHSFRERNWQVVLFWRLGGLDRTSWRVARDQGPQSRAVAIPASIATLGSWEANLVASCPFDFRGLVEVMPVLVSPIGYESLDRDREPSPDSSSVSPDVPPAGSRLGNTAYVETAGVTPGEPASPYRQVESLNANVPLERFRRTLGPPSSWNYLPSGREYLFITPDYCVQAVTDKNGLVVMYAVTALAQSFTPTFRYWGGESLRN